MNEPLTSKNLMGVSFSIYSKRYIELKKYLDNEGDPNAYDSTKCSLLNSCAYHHDLECFELLLQYGANPNQSYYKNNFIFPLIQEIFYGNNQHIKLLLQYGADPNFMYYGCTALHNIVLYPSKYFIEQFNLLMDSGADINIKTKNGNSCIDILVDHHILGQCFPHLLHNLNIKYNVLMKYNCSLKYNSVLKQVPNVLKYWCKRKWAIIRSATKILSLHQRAVVSANHPNRLKQLGVFEIN